MAEQRTIEREGVEVRQPHPELNFRRGKGKRFTALGILGMLDLVGMTEEEKRGFLSMVRESVDGRHTEKSEDSGSSPVSHP